jgi:hypothetical protein
LEQVDKYVPKIIANESSFSTAGKRALERGGVGAIAWVNGDVNAAAKELSFTQLKGDLLVLIDKVMEIAMLMTGLTKAQLLGLTQAETATEARIGQSGQNLRINEKFNTVNDFLNRQIRKLWQVEKQFTNFEEINLITGDQVIDEQGLTRYSWMPDIDSDMADKLAKGEYRFEIEVGAIEKPDLPILRKQIENMINIIGGKGVLEALAAQGWKVELVEILREYMNLFPDMFKIPGKIIKPLAPQQQMAVQAQNQTAQGAAVRPQQAQEQPASVSDVISSIGGERGGFPLA